MDKLTCFKAYDIRGQLGKDLDNDIAYRIGRAYAEFIKPKAVVVGSDVRLSSNDLKASLVNGLLDSGVDVIDLGLTGTEEIYFATSFLKLDGGIEITASHNPIDFNGMKLVRSNSRPISADTGLKEIQELAEKNNFVSCANKGKYSQFSTKADYVQHLLSYIDLNKITKHKIVINVGNGAAGAIVDALEAHFKANKTPVELVKIHNNPDGNFPNGIPNPLLEENRQDSIDAVLEHKADFGVAFDGDFDRCFFFDEKGNFIDGYYVVGLLAQAYLLKNKGAKIIYEPRLTWNTEQVVKEMQGEAVMSRSGHSFIKEKMREVDAIYGGENSSHHYFRDFFFCDSGMIPWLLVLELLSSTGKTLNELISKSMNEFPTSGEINITIADPNQTIAKVEKHFSDAKILHIDGLTVEYADWRFNLRMSNTEPVVRLNIETKGNKILLNEKIALLKSILEA